MWEIEKLLLAMRDMQEMVSPSDELTGIIEKTKKEVSAEISEDDLALVWAARQEVTSDIKGEYD